MSRITDAKFTKRLQTAMYEHEEITLTMVIDEGDDAIAEARELRKATYAILLNKEYTSKVTASGSKTTKKSNEETVKEVKVSEGEKIGGMDVPPVIPEDAKKEKKATTSTASKKASTVKDAPSEQDLKQALIDLTKKLKSRDPVNDLIIQACGEVKSVASMTEKERKTLMKYVEKQ